MNGFGTLYYPSGKKAYEGFWKNDKFEGEGEVFNENPGYENNIDFKNFETIGDNWIKYEGNIYLYIEKVKLFFFYRNIFTRL